MPTIKDVARLAGVSHGTVSNTINGSKSVNSKIVKRVEQAMKELDYQPDAKARSLRSSKTKAIAVVLPNITDSIYAKLYTGIEKITREQGYSLSLYTTNDSRETEETVLDQIQQQRMEGAIVITCMPNRMERFRQLVRAGIRLAFVRRKPDEMTDEIYAGIDEKEAIEQTVSSLLQQGCKEIALLTGKQTYSNEKECADGYCAAMERYGLVWDKSMIKSADSGKENAFRTATWWMQSGNVPKAIITTCSEFAQGVLAAVQMFQTAICPVVLSLYNESWTQNIVPSYIVRVSQRYMLLGELTAQKLFRELETGEQEQPLVLQGLGIVQNSPYGAAVAVRVGKEKKVLRVMMMESAASYASRMMSPHFTRETGIEVEIDTLPYDEIYAQTMDGSSAYDVIQVNASWLHAAVQQGELLCLEDFLSREAPFFKAFSDEIIRQYGTCKGKLYAMPYMFDTQLLFYRKDIFDDLRCQRLYYEQYRTALQPPETWEEFDRIAGFFTQKYNSESPVPYGATLGGYPFYSVYGFIPRLWERGGSVFDENGKFCINSPQAIKALKEYAKAFQFANPSAKNWGWAEQTKQFCQGNAAMMAIYQAHFTDHINQYESKVGGKLGFSVLPGGTSIRGGWSLAVKRASSHAEEAIRFLEWTCSPQNAIPYNILGGSMPSENVFESIEMTETYPWFPQAYCGLNASRNMVEPHQTAISQWKFETIASKIIHLCITGVLSAEAAVAKIEAELKAEIK